jgi:hypothetical protein
MLIVLALFFALTLVWPMVRLRLGTALGVGTPWPRLGWTLMAAGLALVVAAQAQMGASWRIGIDDRPTALRTGGVFALSLLGLHGEAYARYLARVGRFFRWPWPRPRLSASPRPEA